uniref:Uncharacterized protein n=1 Tax=Vitis vinifera TaxID=29760 RepID=A5CB18_VITVI|nr:hypothetical protein VITISV_012434 [Vitis vinifera]
MEVNHGSPRLTVNQSTLKCAGEALVHGVGVSSGQRPTLRFSSMGVLVCPVLRPPQLCTDSDMGVYQCPVPFSMWKYEKESRSVGPAFSVGAS